VIKSYEPKKKTTIGVGQEVEEVLKELTADAPTGSYFDRYF
jgi:hypothetical protein